MKNSFKKSLLFIFQGFLSTCLLLLLLEGAFFVLGFPQGASDFIERAILEQKLEYRKPSGQYRIFVYGESTIHGAGYAPASSPVKWLQAYLKDFLPGRDIQVINFGRLGEGCAFIEQAFQDTLQYKPDLAIFYLGHNTFAPKHRVDAERKKEAEFSFRFKKGFRKSRLISAVTREVIKLKIRRHSQKLEDVMGDNRIETSPPPINQGNENIAVSGSAPYLENIQFFKENIRKIIKSGKMMHVPVLFMKPVCNLKDYPPNLSLHLNTLSVEELARWDQLYQQGQEASKKKDNLLALDFFEKAFAIDPAFADLSFRLGQLYFQKGEIEKARSFFEQARDNDAAIGRAPGDILDFFDDLSSQDQIYYFDTEKAFIPHVPGGILGLPLIEDSVHFSLEGHALAGRGLADEIANHAWIAPRSEWRFDRERSMEEIKKELGISAETFLLNFCRMIGYLARRYDMRLELAQRAAELFPDHPIALRQLAWAYWLLGEKNMALSVYKKLGAKDPQALGAVFQAQPEVKQAYEASITLRPGLKELPRAGT